MSSCFLRKYFKYLCHFSVKEWQKIQICLCLFKTFQLVRSVLQNMHSVLLWLYHQFFVVSCNLFTHIHQDSFTGTGGNDCPSASKQPWRTWVKFTITKSQQSPNHVPIPWYVLYVVPWNLTQPPLQCHNEHDGVSNHQPYDCLLTRLFRRRLKKTSKLRVTGLCVGNSPVTAEFPAQKASNAEDVSIWWRHHVSLHNAYQIL